MLQHNGILVQGVCGEVDAYQVALLVESLEVAPTLSSRYLGSSNLHHVLPTKEGVERRSLVGLITVAITQQCIEKDLPTGIGGKELLPLNLAKTVKATRQGQILKVLTIASGEVDTLGKVENAFVGAVLLPFGDDTLHGSLAHSLHSPQAEADVAFAVDGKLQVTLVHIGAKHLDAHRLAFVH